MYAKIIHKQLNTMTVNNKWNLESSTCPICGQHEEDWKHVLKCEAPLPSTHRELCLADLEIKLKNYKTCPPLADSIYDIVAQQDFNPESPTIVNPHYAYLFEQAYKSQCNIGWENFMRGYISKHWKPIQYEHCKLIGREDIHAVDKWSRMVIKTILEFNRTMWKNRCDIIQLDKKATYDQRQRMDITHLFHYLQDHPDKVPPHSV